MKENKDPLLDLIEGVHTLIFSAGLFGDVTTSLLDIPDRFNVKRYGPGIYRPDGLVEMKVIITKAD